MHLRYFPITPPFVPYPLSKSVDFNYVYRRATRKPFHKTYLVVKASVEKHFYYFCEGPIKVIHYYKIKKLNFKIHSQLINMDCKYVPSPMYMMLHIYTPKTFI